LSSLEPFTITSVTTCLLKNLRDSSSLFCKISAKPNS